MTNELNSTKAQVNQKFSATTPTVRLSPNMVRSILRT